MGRSATRDRGTRRTTRDATRRIKKKPCLFCKDRVEWVDYKDIVVLRKFMSDRGKIRARRVSGCCTRHQREVAVAIKTARELALLPYAQRTVSERSRVSPGRGRGESGGGDGRAPERPSAVAESAVAESAVAESAVAESAGAESAGAESAGAESADQGNNGGGGTEGRDELAGSAEEPVAAPVPEEVASDGTGEA